MEWVIIHAQDDLYLKYDVPNYKDFRALSMPSACYAPSKFLTNFINFISATHLMVNAIFRTNDIN